DADGEVQPEDPVPEAGGVARARVAFEGAPLPEPQEPGQPHRELRKQIVIRDGEGELQAVPESRVAHGRTVNEVCKCRTVSALRRTLTSLSHPRSIPPPAGFRVEEAEWRGHARPA